MNKEQVKQIESLKLTRKRSNSLDYWFELEDLNCHLQYNFNDKDNLISIITFSNETMSGNIREDAKNTHKRTINNIIDKYGKPTIVEKSFTQWNSKDYTINAILNSSDNTVVTYTPPAPSQKDLL